MRMDKSVVRNHLEASVPESLETSNSSTKFIVKFTDRKHKYTVPATIDEETWNYPHRHRDRHLENIYEAR